MVLSSTNNPYWFLSLWHFQQPWFFLANGSDCMINNSADRASPWRIPLLILKYSDCIPLVKRLHLACLYIVSSHAINRSTKLNCFSTLNNQSHSIRSNAFSMSSIKITESSVAFPSSYKTSSLLRIICPIFLHWIHPRWYSCIIDGRTFLIRIAKVFWQYIIINIREWYWFPILSVFPFSFSYIGE